MILAVLASFSICLLFVLLCFHQITPFPQVVPSQWSKFKLLPSSLTSSSRASARFTLRLYESLASPRFPSPLTLEPFCLSRYFVLFFTSLYTATCQCQSAQASPTPPPSPHTKVVLSIHSKSHMIASILIQY